MGCRLLFVVGQLRAGGLERQLYYLLRTIDRNYYAPVVAVWNFREDAFYVRQLRDLGVPIFYPGAGLPGALKLDWFRSLVGRLRPEIIHSYSFYTNFSAWFAATASRTPVVGSVRSEFKRASRQAGFLLGKLCSRWPRVQVFNSFSAAAAAQDVYPLFKPSRIHVVRNGIDLSRFRVESLPSSDLPTIVGIGSLTEVKRWDRLLEAAFTLKQKQFQFHLKIIGDGPLRANLEQYVRELRIDDCVELVGQRTDIPALLSKAVLLVHTSASEGCPNVVMEAMACGRPVVATDVGDVSSLVDDGKTGFVVSQTSADAIADRIAIILRNPSLCDRMSMAARLKAEAEFGLERLLSETFAVYRDAGWGESNPSSMSHLQPRCGQVGGSASHRESRVHAH